MSLPQLIDQTGNPLPTAEEIGRALGNVFARPEFAPASPSWLELALQAIGRSIRAIWNWFVGPLELGPGAGRVVQVVAGIAITAIAIYAVYRLLRGLVRRWRARPKSSPSRTDRAIADAGAASAAEWEARSREAAADGLWREAAVALYHALVLRLDERGAVHFDRAKTPGDYRCEARGQPAARGTLLKFLGIFEPVAYGRVPGGRNEYERLRAVVAAAGANAG